MLLTFIYQKGDAGIMELEDEPDADRSGAIH
jgi:hypothetical protein